MNSFFANLPSYNELNLPISGGSLNLDTMNLGQILSLVLQYAFVLAGFTLLGFILVSGFKLLTSGGNPEQIARAQKTLTNALVGFLIVISSYWVTQIFELMLGLDITTGTDVPYVSPAPTPTNPPTCPWSCRTLTECYAVGGTVDDSYDCYEPNDHCCQPAPQCTAVGCTCTTGECLGQSTNYQCSHGTCCCPN